MIVSGNPDISFSAPYRALIDAPAGSGWRHGVSEMAREGLRLLEDLEPRRACGCRIPGSPALAASLRGLSRPR